jgi:hypothetical protein
MSTIATSSISFTMTPAMTAGGEGLATEIMCSATIRFTSIWVRP